VTIRKSKTDLEGAGQVIGIAYGSKLCPVRALQDWLAAAGISSGPIFRRVDRHGRILERMSPEAVAIVVKRYAAVASLSIQRSTPRIHSGPGSMTQAAINGVRTGHHEADSPQIERHASEVHPGCEPVSGECVSKGGALTDVSTLEIVAHSQREPLLIPVAYH
jgi:hypothetical protein